jgi:hypothetical protein
MFPWSTKRKSNFSQTHCQPSAIPEPTGGMSATSDHLLYEEILLSATDPGCAYFIPETVRGGHVNSIMIRSASWISLNSFSNMSKKIKRRNNIWEGKIKKHFFESWSREFFECLKTFDKLYDSSFGNGVLKYRASLSRVISDATLDYKLNLLNGKNIYTVYIVNRSTNLDLRAISNVPMGYAVLK